MYFNLKNLFIRGDSECVDSSSLNEDKRPYEIVSSSFSIESCGFWRFTTFTGNGGIIFAEIKSISVKIKQTMFFCVNSKASGGVIYVKIEEKSSILLNSVCSESCTCGISCFGQFIYLKSDDPDTKISYQHFSLSGKAENAQYGTSPLSLYLCSLSLTNSNISKSHSFYNSVLTHYIGVDIHVSYSDFFKNFASYSSLTVFNTGDGDISNINMIMSSQESIIESHIMVTSDLPFWTRASVFKNNTKHLFASFKAKLYVESCYIIHNEGEDIYFANVQILNQASTESVIQNSVSVHCYEVKPIKQFNWLLLIIIGSLIIIIPGGVYVITTFLGEKSAREQLLMGKQIVIEFG